MAPSSDDVYKVLQSIDASLKALCAHFGAGEQHASGVLNRYVDVPTIAPDSDLDGQWGNQPIKAKDPREWTGDSQVGKRLSECPPAYLELVALRLEYFATKEEDAKKRRYNLLDASRARGWAQRLRNGWKPPQGDSEPFGGMTAADVPFGSNNGTDDTSAF